MREWELGRESSFDDPDLMRDFREVAFSYLNYAQANISGHRVAAAVLAAKRDKLESKGRLRSKDRTKNTFRIFGGCNLEISVSTVLHAEAVTLYKALSEGYTHVNAVGVTSDHKDQIKPLCGACRQLYMYVNPMTTIYVFDTNKKVKLKLKLKDTMKYPYISKGKIS